MKNKGKLAKKRLLKKGVKDVTNGLLSTTTDLILFLLYLPGASLGKSKGSLGVNQTFEEAYEMLEELNYKKIKRALYHLKKQNLIKSIKQNFIDLEITSMGKKKLKNLLPVYDEKRIWDGCYYLINYDIELNQNNLRNILRERLRKIGAVKLQNSLYFACYNPYKILKDFLQNQELAGTVLVSELGKRGFFGIEDMKGFIWKKAELESLNNQYTQFIEKYKKGKIYSKNQVAIDYYAVLQNDPQFPFELLKDKYLGDKAYLLFLKLTL